MEKVCLRHLGAKDSKNAPVGEGSETIGRAIYDVKESRLKQRMEAERRKS